MKKKQAGGHNQTVTVFTYDDYVAGIVTAEYEVHTDVIPNCAPDAEGKKLLCDGCNAESSHPRHLTGHPQRHTFLWS